MKTVWIDCSPKKKLSASGFIARFTALFTSGEKKLEKLRTRGDYDRVLEAIRGTDNIVFAMPLYVDGVPSHVLPFLKQVETYCRENRLNARVYVIANNGFIEGKQNEPLMQVMENFCLRSGLSWCGGLGIGGGVMMNVMRIVITVYFLIMLLNLALSLGGGDLWAPLRTFGVQLLEVLALGCGIISFALWLARCISKGKAYGKHYTRIMLPSFVFILVADIFFTIISVFQGGVFRGWFRRKLPTEEGR